MPSVPGSPSSAVDCIGRWGQCSDACTKTFTVWTAQAGSGTHCDFTHGTTQTEGCTPGTDDCPGKLLGQNSERKSLFCNPGHRVLLRICLSVSKKTENLPESRVLELPRRTWVINHDVIKWKKLIQL